MGIFTEMKENKKRNEFILIGGLLLAAAVFYGMFRLSAREPAVYVDVSIDGQTIREFPLDQDTEYVIESENGGINRLVIEDGAARITEASCPDKLCISQGSASERGQTIVCLPNRVVITIK